MEELSYSNDLPDFVPPTRINARRASLVSTKESITLRDYWHQVVKHTYLIVALLLIAELGMFAFLLTRTPIYASTSTLLIERQAPKLLESNLQKGEEDDQEVGTFYRTQYEILRSRSLAARVIRALNLERKASFIQQSEKRSKKRQEASEADETVLGVKTSSIEKYLKALMVRPVFETRLVAVTFSSPDPALAATVTNAHVREFIQQNYDQQAGTSEEAQRYLGGKLEEVEGRVEKSEAALNNYRRDRGLVEFSLDDKYQMIADRLATLGRKIADAEEARISLEADVQTIKDGDYDSLPAVIDDALIRTLKEASAKLEGEYANLSNQFTPDYPPVAQLKAQLLEQREQERAEIEKVVKSVKGKYHAAVDLENELRQEFEKEKSHAMALKDASLQAAVLERDVATNRALYESLLERIKTLGVLHDSQMNNITIIDRAETPRRPSSPKKNLILVLTGFLSLFTGVGIALVLEATNSGLKTGEEVQSYLQLPNLATVVRFKPLKEVAFEPVAASFARSNACDTDGKSYALVRSPAVREAYRAIRTAILLSPFDGPRKSILFSSAVGGEGKSSCAANTAMMFALMDQPVLLIDADLRRPRCHRIIGGNSQPGLSEVLAGRRRLDEVIQSTGIKGLFFVGAGLQHANPTELLASGKMREVLAAATSLYARVLVDSPPILPLSDSLVLSTLVDGVIMVVHARTAKELVGDACGRLIYVGSKILGVVLNNADVRQQLGGDWNYTY